MSDVMDRKVVEMQFDNAQFEKGVKTSMSTLDKLKASLKFEGVDKGFDDIEKRSGRIDFSGMRDAIDTVSYKFSALESMALGALMRIGERAVDAGIKLAKSLSIDNVSAGWSKFEEKTKSVGTLIAQGYNLSLVNEQLEKLNFFTDETSYSFTNMVAEIAKFTATGKGLEESVTALMGIANWAAMSGQNASTASRAMFQLSQAMGAGVMRKEDYKSIQNVSMDTVEFRQRALDAAEAIGTLQKNADGTYQSLVKGAKSSKFTISQFADHLTQDAWFTSDVMMKVYTEYAYAVDEVRNYMIENGVDTASEAMRQLAEINKTETDENKKALMDFGLKALRAAQEARSWGDTVESVREAVASGFSKTFEIIFGQYDEAVDLWTDLAERLYEMFATPLNNFNEVLETGLKKADTYVNRYFEGIAEGESEVITRAAEFAKVHGYASKETEDFILGLAHGNHELSNLILNYVKLNKIGKGSAAELGASKGIILDYITTLTNVSKEDAESLKTIGDQMGYNSDEYVKELNRIYGSGNKGSKEIATHYLKAIEDMGTVDKSNFERYLTKTVGLTSEQISELQNLSKQYGATSDEVDAYLKKIDGVNKSTRLTIEGILELVDRTWNTGDVVSYVTNLTGASEDSVKILWDLVKTQNELESSTDADTEAIAKNAEEIEKWATEIADGDEALAKEILDLMGLKRELDSMSGYRNLLEAFNNVWDYLAEILGTVKEAFQEVFPPLTADRIYTFTERIKAFTERLELSKESAEKIKRVFSGFFSIFKLMGQAIKPVVLPIKAFFEELMSGSEAFSDGIAKAGDWITKLAKSGKVAETSEKIFGRLADAVRVIVRSFKDFINVEKIIETYNSSGGGFFGILSVIHEKIHDIISSAIDFIAAITGWDPTELKKKIETAFDGISGFFKRIFGNSGSATEQIEKAGTFSKLKDGLKNFALGVKNVFLRIKEAISNSKLADTLHNIWLKIKDIGSTLGDFLAKVLDKIGEKLNDINMEDILSFLDRLINLIGLVIGGAATLELIDFVEWIKEMPAMLLDAVTGFSTFLEGFGDALDAFRKRIQVKTVRDIGIALFLIAAALMMIASIPADKLDTAVFAMANLAGVLVGVLAAIKGMSDESLQKKSKTKFDSGIFLKIAASLLIIAFAVKQFKDMSEDQIKSAVGAMIALMAGMVLVIEILGKSKNLDASKISKSMSGMILMAVALRIVVSSVKALSKLDPEGLKSGMIATVVLMALMVAVAGIMSKFDKPGKVITASSGLIVFAVALRLVVWSVKALAKLDPESAKNGISDVIPLIVLMVAAAAVMSKLDKPGKAITASVGLIAFAVALRIIVSSVKALGDMSPKSLKKSITGVTFLIAEMVAAAAVMSMLEKPSKVISSSIGLIAFAAALRIIVSSVKVLGEMTGPDLKKGLLAVTALIIELVAASVILSEFSSGKSLIGAAGLLAMVSALSLLPPIMKAIATMSWGDIIKALVAFAAVIAIVVTAGYALKKVSKSLLAGAAAMALFGVGVALLGAGLQLIAFSLGSLGTGIKLFFAGIAGSIGIIVTVIKSTLTGLIELIPLFITKLGEGLMGLLGIIAANEETMKNAFLAILKALLGSISEGVPEIVGTIFDLIVGILDKLNEKLPELIDKISSLIVNAINGLSRNLPDLIKAGFDFVKSLIEGIIAALADFKIENIDDLSKAVENLLGIMLMLGSMSLIFPFAMAGVLGLGSIAIALVGAIAALGAISKIQGISMLVDSGGDLLGKIGQAIGKLIGGIVGGVMAGVASMLPLIGSALSDFAMGIVPFIMIMKMVDGAVLEGAGRLVGALLALTAAEVIAQIAEFFGADMSFESLGDRLENLGHAMVRFSESTAELNPESFNKVVEAAGGLVALSKSLPNTEGLWGWIAGKQDLGEFGDKLGQFATGLTSFAEAARGISEEDCTSMMNVANALVPIVDLSKKLPNTEGAWGWIAGKQDLGEFGDKLAQLTLGLVLFAGASRNISEEDCDSMVNVAKALDPIVELSKKLPNTEGAWGWLAGKQDIGEFGNKLGSLAVGMQSFAISARWVNEADIAKMILFVGVADPLVELSKKLPNTEGAWGWLAGKQDLGEFGDNLKKFGEGVKGFAEEIRGVTSTDISTMSNMGDPIDTIVTIANKIDSVSDVKKLKTFSGTLKDIAKGIKDFVSTWTKGINNSDLEAAVTAVGNIADLASRDVNGNTLTSIANGVNSLATSGINGFVDTFRTSETDIKTSISTFITTAVNTIRSERRSFYSAGEYLIDGFVKGMNDKLPTVESTAERIGKASINSLNKAIEANSPAKASERSGGYFMQGFINGVDNYVGATEIAAGEAGKSALDGLTDAISNSIGTSDFDNTITIKPVIDLTEVQNGVDEINRIIGGLNGYSIDGSTELLSSTANSMSRGKASSINDGFNEVTKAVDRLGDKLDKPVEQHNSFNFYGLTQDEMVRRVKDALSQEIIRGGRRWA